ncbi:MAG: hypothetical protein CVU03_11310 [Bacteroidetes bacterium HGW-Bacteroidetes-2]|jgi:hypothetical protein|nr:MAG: hypothetical protein CVU03_11310 [Bacteroidetes bacterium HGW-Bacteroidetes-2]
MKIKSYIFLFFILFSGLSFGQLVSPTFFDIVINVSEDGNDYSKIGTFYKKQANEEEFVKTRGIHERLINPQKDVVYFIEFKNSEKQIALYFYMPFSQESNNETIVEIPIGQEFKQELGIEMFLVNEIRFDITDLGNGTYFIDYSKDLYLTPNSHEVKPTGEGLSIIYIPSKTLEKCKVSTEFIPKENYSKSINDLARFTVFDCAHGHICCRVNCPCCPEKEQQILFGKQTDTVYIKENKYVLSKSERDSIFNSVYLQEKTQQLLKSYETENNKNIFLAENHFNFLSVLNSNLVHHKKKRNLLIDRIKQDEQSILTKNKNIKTSSDRISPSKFSSSDNKQSVRIEQPYYSKEETLVKFMDKVEIKEYIDFSYSHFLFVKVDYSKEDVIQSIEFPSYSNLYGGQFKLTPTKEIIRKIKNLHITEIDYIPNYVTFSPMHATTEFIDQIVIYYEK